MCVLFRRAMLWPRSPGLTPSSKSQAVLYTAHYDHLGIHANESGRQHLQRRRTTTLPDAAFCWRLARAFVNSKEKPRRTHHCLPPVTAEEQGLLWLEVSGRASAGAGAQYFARSELRRCAALWRAAAS